MPSKTQLRKQRSQEIKKANMHFSEGRRLFREGHFSQAIEELSIVLKYIPDQVECVSIIAACALECGDFELARKLNFKALEMDPTNQTVLNNCGKFWETLGDWDNTVKFYMTALQHNPNSIVLKNNCGMALLRSGNLKQGWEFWEHRHDVARKLGARMSRMIARNFPQKKWDGSPLIGKKLIIWAEQGVGDEMLYGSMLPDMKRFGGSITVECEPRLVELFQRSFPSFKFVPSTYKDAESGKDHFDYQISLGSLAQFVRSEVSDFPDTCDFLIPDPDHVKKWQKRFGELGDKPKVGISWRSMRKAYDRDMFYAQIEDLRPLAEGLDVNFINMQYAYDPTELEEFQELFGKEIHNWWDMDLKDDLNQLVGYSHCLDANICPASTPSAFSGGQNIPTFLFLNTDEKNMDTLGQGRHVWFPSVNMYYKGMDNETWDNAFNDIVTDINKLINK